MLSPIELFLTCVSTLHGPTSDISARGERSAARSLPSFRRTARGSACRVRRRPRQPSLCRLLPPQTPHVKQEGNRTD